MMNCPNCGEEILPNTYNVTKAFLALYAGTLDCKCGALLLIEYGEAKDFHKAIHAEDKRWPAEGGARLHNVLLRST